MQGSVWELYWSLSVCLNLLRFRVSACFDWQDSHISTQGWKVRFWGSLRGNSVWILKWTNLLGIFCKLSFTPAVTSCYQVHALNADARLSATLLCFFRCNWCRNLAAVNCTLHWIVLTLFTLQMRITLVVVRRCITELWLHHNHKISAGCHKNGLVSSQQFVGRWFIFICFVVRIFWRNQLAIKNLLVSVSKWNSWLEHFAFMWIVFTFVELFSYMWDWHNC